MGDARYLEMQIENNQMEIRSEPTDNVNEHGVVISNQGTQSHAKYEWALFRKKKLKNVFMKNIRTSGYWKILTRDSLDDDADLFEMEEKKEKEVGGFDIFTTDLKKSGSEPYDDVVVVHRDLSDLNAILLFFHQMEIDPFFNESDEQKLDFSPSDLSQMKQPIIRIIIQHEEMSSIPDNRFVDEDGSQKNIVEFSDDGKEQSIEEERWYDIYWWNQAKDADKTHAIAMKTYASNNKFEYYLRYTMPSIAKIAKLKRNKSSLKNLLDRNHQNTENEEMTEDILEWVWYDNDLAIYRGYDLGSNVLKQLEASFHANCNRHC